MAEHPILASHPEWQAYQERVADNRRRADAIRLQVLEAERDHVAEAAKFDDEVAEAARTGGVAPENPPQPRQGPARALALIRAEGDALREEGRAVLARIGPEVEQALAARVSATLTGAKKPATVLSEVRSSLLEDCRLAEMVRTVVDAAAGITTRPSRANRTRSTLDYDELIVELVLGGGNLLALAPVSVPVNGIRRDMGVEPHRLAAAAPGYRPLPPGRV